MKIALLSFLVLFSSVSGLPTPQNPTSNAAAQNSSGGSTTLNAILLAVGKLPGIGSAITSLSAGLTSLEQDLATTLAIQTTESETGCTAMTVIFARGTTEPGNVGVLTGPEFFDALNTILGAGAVTVQGVEYPASIAGFLEGGDPQGSQTM